MIKLKKKNLRDLQLELWLVKVMIDYNIVLIIMIIL